MAKSTRKTLLLAKIQTAPGADPIPTGAADAMLVRNLTPTPLSAEFVDRELLRPYMGNAGQIATTQYSQLEFEVELAGAGEAGKSPAWGACLQLRADRLALLPGWPVPQDSGRSRHRFQRHDGQGHSRTEVPLHRRLSADQGFGDAGRREFRRVHDPQGRQ
ncbi:hypothetical protein G6F22_019309 [Rhizopus arrhizus]|nr:hypothetical protein G6F22_019309 [Rhizopus arrhizus]